MIRRVPLLALAIGTMALAACGGGNDEPDPNAPCESHSDCAGNPNGEYCSEDAACVECAATLHCDSGLLCDLTDNTCVGCRDNLDCGGDVCDPETRTCVQCLADADCGVWSLCDVDTKTCDDLCATDFDCAGSEEGPACDRATGACVPCMSDGHCPSGEKCDLNDNTCYPAEGCDSNVDCIGDASGPGCDTATGHCVSCLQDSHCGDGATCESGRCVSDVSCQGDSWCTDSICDEAAGSCVECLQDADCTYSQYATLCDTNRSSCVQCLSDADCEDGSFCDAASGACEACASDDHCTDAITPSCIKKLFWGFIPYNDCGCKDDASCQDPSAPFCHSSGEACVACTANEHCTDEAAPFCHEGSGTCVECLADLDCSDPAAPFCDPGTATCTPCLSEFDCNDPAAPVCVRATEGAPLSCGSYDACTSDDAGEPSDDGLSGATDLTPATGDTTVLARKICSEPQGAERDWYRFDVADGDSATLTATWSTTAQLTLVVYRAEEVDGVMGYVSMGQSPAVVPAEVRLTYLPAGTYYAFVSRVDSLTAEPADYEMTFTRVQGQACTSVADCAAEYQTQYFRASCDTATGACVELDGQGLLQPGDVCDSPDDCASSNCSYGWAFSGQYYGFFMANADTRARCVAAYCDTDADCGEGEVCNLGWCAPPCTTDAECPIDLSLESTDDWPRFTCNVTTGQCE